MRLEATCCFHSLIIIIILSCLIFLWTGVAGFGPVVWPQQLQTGGQVGRIQTSKHWQKGGKRNKWKRSVQITLYNGKTETKSSTVSFCLSKSVKMCVKSSQASLFSYRFTQINTGTHFGIRMEVKSKLCFLENLSWTADGRYFQFPQMRTEKQTIDNDGGGEQRPSAGLL